MKYKTKVMPRQLADLLTIHTPENFSFLTDLFDNSYISPNRAEL